ncbi:MAG TPA: adenylyltransferase/cytidyltransferase family protein [Longimicrobiales bacterium]|nr:adenylyltransferase/cytidyltransferase family protein [Longimicrobiales bacterium]
MSSPRAVASKVLTRGQVVERYGPSRPGAVVFTNGCFEILHAGHVSYLDQARALGDALVVGVNTDASARRLEKGPGRPFVPQDERALVVAAIESVDAVSLFDEDTPAELIRVLLPAVLVKGADYATEDVVGREAVEAAGGRVELVPLLEGRSTTGLLRRIRGDA